VEGQFLGSSICPVKCEHNRHLLHSEKKAWATLQAKVEIGLQQGLVLGSVPPPFVCPLHSGGGRRHKYKLRLGYDPRVFLEDPALRGQKLSVEAEQWAAEYRSRIPMVSDPQVARRLGVDAPQWLGPPALDAQRAQATQANSRSLRQHLFSQPSDSEQEEYEIEIDSEEELTEQIEADRRAEAAAMMAEAAADRREASMASADRSAAMLRQVDALREQRMARTQARAGVRAGAMTQEPSARERRSAELMREVSIRDQRLPDLLEELESRALALEQIRATSLAARYGERRVVRNVEHLSIDAMQRRVSRITNYLQRQTGVSITRSPNLPMERSGPNLPHNREG